MGIKDIDNLTVNDIKTVTISFKKNEDELALYKWILKHSGYSSFVKDTLRKIMESEEVTNVEFKQESKTLNSTANQDNNLIDLNF